MKYIWNDGGRAEAGYKGHTGDCVTRAIAIATELPYKEVYKSLHEIALNDRPYMAKLELQYGSKARAHVSPRLGVHRRIYDRFMLKHGWIWVPTMQIGSGCQVHLRKKELPKGRLVVRLSKHVTAVIDGVIHDTHDPQRESGRCVYGFWHGPS